MACRFVAALILICVVFSTGVMAQATPSVVPTQPSWSQLSASQRTALMPLAKEWDRIPDDGKLKWLGIAVRYAKMTPQEQARLQDRMRAWVSLSPMEREQARAQYKKLRTVPADAKKLLEQKWQEYEALPAEEKLRLKEAAKQAKKTGQRPVLPQTSQSSVTTGMPAPVIVPRVVPPKPLAIAPDTPRRLLFQPTAQH